MIRDPNDQSHGIRLVSSDAPPAAANAGRGGRRGARPDPARLAADAMRRIDLDIIAAKLRAVTDEMGAVLVRTSTSPVVKEILDFACCICDADGRLVTQNNGITVLTGTISGQLGALRRKFAATMRPGDIFITNNPYDGNTHTADVTLVKPVFVEGELVCFTTATAHWSDLGGKVAGSLSPDAAEIFEEGLRLPNLRIVREGMLQEDLVDMIFGNVRLPETTRADLACQLAVVRLAEARVREMHAAYGADLLAESFERVLDLGERLCRAAVASLPKGVFNARGAIEVSGEPGGHVPIQVRIGISGDEITADFTGCGPQQPVPLNCTRGALEAAAKAALMAVLRPGAALNDGWFRPLKVVAPEGTIVTARNPAPTGWCYEAASCVMDLVCKALAQAVPERLGAGSYTSLCVAYFGGRDAEGGTDFVLVEPHVGGWGGSAQADGASALIAPADGDTYNHPVEMLEAGYPIRVTAYALNREARSGAGTFRGGFGVVRSYEMLADDLFFFTSLGRSSEGPWAIGGGEPGSANYFEVETGGTIVRGSRASFRTLRRGDRVRIATGNGGGFGEPFARVPAAVLADLANGHLDAATAADLYGVAVREQDHGFVLDEAATARLRAGDGDGTEGGTQWAR